jgi:hypothetical protein
MSWEEAQREAEKWLRAAGVPPGKIKGEHFDLHEKMDLMPPKVGYRAIILRAAKRSLEKRGAKAWSGRIANRIRRCSS